MKQEEKSSYDVLLKALITMYVFDGFFTWLTISIYSYHVLELGFSPFFLAIAYAAGEICRIVVAIWSKYYSWWLPIIVMFVTICVTIPAALDATTHFSMFCLALQKGGELLPFNAVQIGLLMKKKQENVIDRQYRCQTVTSICTGSWVLGYSVGSLVCGLLYEFWTIRPLLIIQLGGFSATAILHLGLKINDYSFENPQRQASVVDSQQEKQKVQEEPQKKFLFPAVLWTWALLPIFFQGASIAIFMVFVKLYQTRFGIGPTVSCLVQMMGDVLGSLWCIAKGHLRTIYKTKQRADSGNTILNRLAYCVKRLSQLWFFRSPRDVSFTLLSVCTAMYMMCANVLWVVIIGHIATGALYVREYQLYRSLRENKNFVLNTQIRIYGSEFCNRAFDLLPRPPICNILWWCPSCSVVVSNVSNSFHKSSDELCVSLSFRQEFESSPFCVGFIGFDRLVRCCYRVSVSHQAPLSQSRSELHTSFQVFI